MAAFSISLSSPFLITRFTAPQNMLSWSLTRPGFLTADTVAWLQVSDTDLPASIDPADFLERRMAAAGYESAIQLMTACDLEKYSCAKAVRGSVKATCLATVGLANASRVGETSTSNEKVGTINLLAHIDQPLAPAALIEALSIAAEARTAAVIDLNLYRNGRIVTGTGTDCIVVAAPSGVPTERFAGLHTDIGTALGKAVYDAVKQGGDAWLDNKIGNRSKAHAYNLEDEVVRY